MRKIGDIIATYRKKNNLSQTELSAILIKNGFQIGNKAISNWEKDKAEPSTSVFLFLCKQLGITDIYGNPDYYKFTVSKDGYIDINFNENQNARFKFELYNEAKERYGTYNTESGSGTKVQKVSLKKGTNYLKVYKYNSGEPNTQYSFSVGSPSVKKSN